MRARLDPQSLQIEDRVEHSPASSANRAASKLGVTIWAEAGAVAHRLRLTYD